MISFRRSSTFAALRRSSQEHLDALLAQLLQRVCSLRLLLRLERGAVRRRALSTRMTNTPSVASTGALTALTGRRERRTDRLAELPKPGHASTRG